MRIAVAIALLMGVSLVAAQESNVEEVGKSPVEAKFAADGDLRLDLCSSGVEVVGSDEPLLRVSYERRSYRDVRTRIKVDGKNAEIKVTDCPNGNFQVRIEVPKNTNLYARQFAGQLDIQGVSGDKDVQLHAGQLNLDVDDPTQYGHVEASVTSGDLEASPFGVSKGGLFRSFERSGPGKYRLHAHVGAGQLELR